MSQLLNARPHGRLPGPAPQAASGRAWAWWPLIGALLGATGCLGADEPTEQDYTRMRHNMVHALRAYAQTIDLDTGHRGLDPRVLAALDKVPRHRFVPAPLRAQAYANHPLPIGLGQTISQPYIVALMTDLAGIDPGDKVLEIGTGSGYQTAVLAELAHHVYSIEILPELGAAARARLRRLGYDHVSIRIGDGYAGWPAHAPYDAILVTAAAEQIPAPLIEQLKPGGRMVIPVGDTALAQELTMVEKDPQGQVRIRAVLAVAFVPLTGEH